jgi:hypothetical protein
VEVDAGSSLGPNSFDSADGGAIQDVTLKRGEGVPLRASNPDVALGSGGGRTSAIRKERGMRRALPYLLGVLCVVAIVGIAAGVWFSYEARQQAKDAKDEVAVLSSDVDSLQTSIDNLDTSGGDGSTATVDDVSSSVDDLQSSVDDLSSTVDAMSSTLDDVSSQVDNVCYALPEC